MGSQRPVVRAVTIVLSIVAIIAAGALLHDLFSQIYFEPSPGALARARAGRHNGHIWAAVLIGAGFVATVTSDRALPLVNVFVGLAAFLFTATPVVVGLGCVAVVLVDLFVASAAACAGFREPPE